MHAKVLRHRIASWVLRNISYWGQDMSRMEAMGKSGSGVVLTWRQGDDSVASNQGGDLNILALQDKEPIGKKQEWRL